MKYRISDNSDSPAYLQLYRQLKQDIVDTVYACGCKLPSKRLMAEDLGISTVTVEHAYYLLCDEGYVESRERSGYFVIFRTNDGFAVSSNEHKLPAATVNNTHGTEPTFPFSVLAKTMRRVLSIHGEAMLDRSPSKGLSELRTVICEYLARNRGINASPEQIIVGSGAEYLYGLIVELLGRDKIYGIESPSYHKIEQVYRTKDVKYEFLHLGSDGISSTDLCLTSANVLHTTPFRSYPTGITASASKLHEYILWSGK